MSTTADGLITLEVLDTRLKVLLPAEYRDTYETMQPISMGSAGLKFDVDGRVAWNEIWGSFCDLAMAGGPPHKGALLLPGEAVDIATHPERHDEVVDEICRGIRLTTDLSAVASATPGWVRVMCYSDEMAGWLLRAICMENVSVRRAGRSIELPAGPAYRLDKEIKNVVTVVAKTCHYWLGHMPAEQKAAIAALFRELDAALPLIEPGGPLGVQDDQAGQDDQDGGHGLSPSLKLSSRVYRDTGLIESSHAYAGWLGVECPNVATAVWLMRALVATNVLSRREGGAVFLPVNPETDHDGARVAERFAAIHQLSVRQSATH